MKFPAPETIFFCLVTGAALGGLFLLLQWVRVLLRAGKFLTAFLDLLYCCLCAAAVFMCALAVDHGRLRLVQVLFQAVGAWAAVGALGPFIQQLAFGMRRIFGRVSGLFKRAGAFFGSLFLGKRASTAKNAKKTRQKGKKQQKKT